MLDHTFIKMGELIVIVCLFAFFLDNSYAYLSSYLFYIEYELHPISFLFLSSITGGKPAATEETAQPV
jgi:hypothetical protein